MLSENNSCNLCLFLMAFNIIAFFVIQKTNKKVITNSEVIHPKFIKLILYKNIVFYLDTPLTFSLIIVNYFLFSIKLMER